MTQIEWLDEVKSFQDSDKSIRREDILRLLDKGKTLTPTYNVESTLSTLTELLKSVDEWETKAKALLHSKTRVKISQGEALENEAEKIDAYLPSLDLLGDAVTRAKNWQRTVEELQSKENIPYYDTLEDLSKKAHNIPFQLDALESIDETIAQAKAWRERTARTFLRKNSHYSLMEALSPRICVGVPAIIAKTKKNKVEESGAIYVCDTKLDDSNDSATVVAAFKLAETREMEAMKNLREKNLSKHLQSEPTYCVCRKAKNGPMVQCELCKDFFHREFHIKFICFLNSIKTTV